MMIGGITGICYTYTSISRENIVTPNDASIPGTPVGGPLTAKSQADIIRTHTLTRTGGLTFAKMPRTIPKLDEAGAPVLDEKGEVVMVPNTPRETWFQALTLITALNLGILTYAFSLLSIVLGSLFVLIGYVFLSLRK